MPDDSVRIAQHYIGRILTGGTTTVTRLRSQQGLGYTLIEMLAVMTIIASMSGMAIPKLHEAIDKAKVARAIGDIRAIQLELMAMEGSKEGLPATLAGVGRGGMLDPWGNPYVYTPFGDTPGVGGKRMDKFIVPLNSTFDLYSMGKDGRTNLALTASASHDDIVRADDGGFIGLGEKF